MIFIGDMHSSWTDYKAILQKQKRLGNETCQVGDLGLGFMPIPEDYQDWIDPWNNKFIRGNHDNPALCNFWNGYLGDFGTYIGNSLSFFYVSGAASRDKLRRVEGFDWWKDEELSYNSLQEAIKVYGVQNREVMVTHCCPSSMIPFVVEDDGDPSNSITAMALDIMLRIQPPKLWIFGHYHKWFDKTINGTRFVCVPSLQEFEVR